MSKYIVVIEKGASNYSGYVADLPDCVAAAETIDETERLISEAIAIHIRGLREDVAEPTSIIKEVEVRGS
jgi:predicted RNase H-like HicB family nuclease